MLWQKVGNGNLSLRNISGRVSQVQEDVPKCQNEVQSAKDVVPKCQNDTLELSMEELALLKVIKNNPAITQAELVGITGQSLRTIKRLMAAMQAKGCIARQGGKRFGHWQIL